MRERPILFTPENVRLILAGHKVQTRRVINPQPNGELCDDKAFDKWAGILADACRVYPSRDQIKEKSESLRRGKRVFPFRDANGHLFSPRNMYGVPGDRLWVREGWGIGDSGGRLIDPCINYRAGGQLPLIGHASPDTWSIAGNKKEVNDLDLMKVKDGWHNAMFMPRWASRITLEIADVKIERVQDISEDDAIAEGIKEHKVIVGANCNGGIHREETGTRYFYDGSDEEYETASDAYAALWDSINAKKHPWASNCWVWALTFRMIDV